MLNEKYNQDKCREFPSIMCPCCGNEPETYLCNVCNHKWRPIRGDSVNVNYAEQAGRNSMPKQFNSRKVDERIQALKPFIFSGMRVLDIGCAEGELGKELKKIENIHVTGVEPSRDAERAVKHLDQTYDYCSDIPSDHGCFDLIVSFHVLEHIADIRNELRAWRHLISKGGKAIFEVPCGTGHHLVLEDKNKEHLHSFSFTSLSCLLVQSGFDVIKMTRGHFESPVYNDSLRVLTQPSFSRDERIDSLLKNFSFLPENFFIYGIGGDFENYVLPIFDMLNIGGLLDKNPQGRRFGRNSILVEEYDFAKHADRPILISSVRFQQEIFSDLISFGHPKKNIYFLSDIYSDEEGDD